MKVLSIPIFPAIENLFWTSGISCLNLHIRLIENSHPQVIGKIMEEMLVLPKRWSKHTNWLQGGNLIGRVGVGGQPKHRPTRCSNLVSMLLYYTTGQIGKGEK